MYNKLINSIITTCVLSILCMIPAIAQEQTHPKATVNDDKLKSFVIASSSIHHLQNQTFSQMENIESEQLKQEAANRANQQILQALQAVGLTADEYIAIRDEVQTDPQLQEKVKEIASDMDQSKQIP
ncbi:protein of unknown function [Nitrosomonas aestuarii]|uniref:DUF4168 domain-containing protein n=1 Tax=Nitrosomonas aestuarii TaxID=52441 RepID=A0A1I4GW18_9PROT|nr:DUF4168 domain-containing protein [Nitrosomonas aestuarii]SFL34218.1 protein of unknown function [Nitrosomonas aestuarii]